MKTNTVLIALAVALLGLLAFQNHQQTAVLRGLSFSGSQATTSSPADPSGAVYEFKSVSTEVEIVGLNKFGAEGWQVAAATPVGSGPTMRYEIILQRRVR